MLGDLIRARLAALGISAATLHRELVRRGARGPGGKAIVRQTVYKWLSGPAGRVEQENVAALLDALTVPPEDHPAWWRGAGYGTVLAAADETAA